MTIQNNNLSMIFLKPGELFLSDKQDNKPVKITTVLGSCVSVTLYHNNMAAMCHAVMPYCVQDNGCPDSYRYVNFAVSYMIKNFKRHGIYLSEIEAKLFGGSDMFENKFYPYQRMSVGRQNIEAAIKIIEKWNMRFKKIDVGGFVGRKIIFFPKTGRVWLKHLQSNMFRSINNTLLK